VSAWASSVPDRTPTEVAQETGERVRRAAASILDRLQTDQIGAGDPPAFGLSEAVRDFGATVMVAPDQQPARLDIRSL
jgi:hypothetical protein